MSRPPATRRQPSRSTPSPPPGRLPFVGRAPELDRIHAFWQRTPHADELRVMLVRGEAGIGKSRLVEALVPRIESERGLVVHIRVYPDSGTDLAHLLAGALGSRQDAFRRETKSDHHATIDAIRRMARLRALLLVIEDVHLLDEHGSHGLGGILEMLAGERIAVLLLARPLELACRAVLERYLEEQMVLQGLGADEIEEIWSQATNRAPSPALLDLVAEGTLGNPLAIRSMLREAHAPYTAGGAGSVESDSLAARMRRSVDLLSEGLLVELSHGERAAATQLALLGEVFSREAAEVMVEGSGDLIDALIDKGIVALATLPPQSVVGLGDKVFRTWQHDSAFPPIEFTHTLVHRSLLMHAPVDSRTLLEVIGGGHPLYSHLPFIRLALFPSTARPGFDLLYRVVNRTINLTRVIKASLDWERVGVYAEALAGMTDRQLGALPPYEQRIIKAKIRNLRQTLLPRTERMRIVDHGLDLSREPLEEILAQIRLTALIDAYNDTLIAAQGLSPSALRPPHEIDELVAQFPELYRSAAFLYTLTYGLNVESYWEEWAFRHKSEGLAKILSDPLTSDELRADATFKVGTQLLLYFTTPAELEQRREFHHRHFDNVNFDRTLGYGSDLESLRFLQCIGEVDAVIQRCRVLLDWLSGRDRQLNSRIIFNILHLTRVSLGFDLDQFLQELTEFDRHNSETSEDWLIGDMARSGILCGRTEWSRTIIAMLDDGDDPRLEGYSRVCLALDDEEMESALLEGCNPGFGWECIEALGALLLRKPDSDLAAATAAAAEVLTATTIRVDQLLLRRAVLKLIDALRDRMPDAYDWSRFDAPAHGAAIGELEWLAERRIPAYMPPILELLQRHGTVAELRIWHKRYEQILGERLVEMAPAAESLQLMVSMLDTITTRMAGDGPVRVRGSRVQALLATLVADRMLATPLTQSEFWRITAGGEKDPEKARNITNMTVHRLRDLLGEDAIITPTAGAGQTGMPPRLNMELVEIDLLQADRMVAEARQALRSGALMRAVPLLSGALDISDGRIPFPGLYDDFFEATRGDFESRLRDATMDVSRALLREEDAGGAEAILRRAFTAMPDDEEISELLRTTLVLLDRRSEAERVRLRVE